MYIRKIAFLLLFLAPTYYFSIFVCFLSRRSLDRSFGEEVKSTGTYSSSTVGR